MIKSSYLTTILTTSIFITILLSGCAADQHDRKVYNLKDYIAEHQLSAQEITMLQVQDDHINEYLLNVSENVQFTHVKMSTVSFRDSGENLVPVSNDDANRDYTLSLYNIIGYSKQTINDIIIGVYEWDHYPIAKNEAVDKLKVNLDFKIPVKSLNAIFSYNTGDKERFQSFSLYHQGYIWDIYKTKEKFPIASAVYVESARPNVFDESRIQYHFQTNTRNAEDKFDVIVVESVVH